MRVLGDVTQGDALDVLRQVDEVYIQSIRDHGLYDKIWQAFAVFLPVRWVAAGQQRQGAAVFRGSALLDQAAHVDSIFATVFCLHCLLSHPVSGCQAGAIPIFGQAAHRKTSPHLHMQVCGGTRRPEDAQPCGCPQSSDQPRWHDCRLVPLRASLPAGCLNTHLQHSQICQQGCLRYHQQTTKWVGLLFFLLCCLYACRAML